MIEDEDKTYQNLQNVGKAMFRGKFIAVNVSIKTEEKSQINSLSFHLQRVDQKKQTKLKVSSRKNIIKIIVKINEVGYK